MATTVPAAGVGEVCDCAQKVSPLPVSSHWWRIVWPAPSVRAVAPSQSLPAPKTHEPGRGRGQRRARGARRRAGPARRADAAGAREGDHGAATGHSRCCDGVEVTVVAAAEAGAVAFQISEVPRRVFARRTSDQVSPPPETVAVCAPLGPSEDTKASSRSPVCAGAEGRRRHRAARRRRSWWRRCASSPGTGGGVALETLSATDVGGVRAALRVGRARGDPVLAVDDGRRVPAQRVRARRWPIPTTLPSTRNWTPPPPGRRRARRQRDVAEHARAVGRRAPRDRRRRRVGVKDLAGASPCSRRSVTFTSVSLLASLASAKSLLGSVIARNQ